MTTLQHYLNVIDQLLEHGRQHLHPEQWKVFTRRLVGTPLEQGYSVQERWTARMMVEYYWPRLSTDEQDAFVQQQCSARRKGEEGTP